MFEKKTTKGTLMALATLIDWNELGLFDSCRAKIAEFLRIKGLRSGAFRCFSAFFEKEMSEQHKLTVIKQSGYLEEVRDASYYLLASHDNYGS